MTVKIIDEGPDPSVVKQIICKNCGVKLEYLPVDILDGTTSDYTGSKDIYHYINCLKCNKEVIIKGY